MKFVKFSVLALSLGFFVASCGDNTTTTEEVVQEEVVVPAPEETAPVAEEIPADSTVVPVAPVTEEAPAQ